LGESGPAGRQSIRFAASIQPCLSPGHAIGMARPTHYKPDFVRHARFACGLGMDNAALADFLSVSPATLYRWLQRYPDFAAAAEAGRKKAAARVQTSSYRRATGYEYQAEKVFRRRDGTPVVARFRRRVLADPKVALRWLRSRRPEEWRLPAARSATAGNETGVIPKTEEKRIDSHNPSPISALKHALKTLDGRDLCELLDLLVAIAAGDVLALALLERKIAGGMGWQKPGFIVEDDSELLRFTSKPPSGAAAPRHCGVVVKGTPRLRGHVPRQAEAFRSIVMPIVPERAPRPPPRFNCRHIRCIERPGWRRHGVEQASGWRDTRGYPDRRSHQPI